MKHRILKVALVQFDAPPERVRDNVRKIKTLATRAAKREPTW